MNESLSYHCRYYWAADYGGEGVVTSLPHEIECISLEDLKHAISKLDEFRPGKDYKLNLYCWKETKEIIEIKI